MVNEKGVLEKFRQKFYKRIEKECNKASGNDIKRACVEVMLEVVLEDDAERIITKQYVFTSDKKKPKKNSKIGDVL